jgi:hypothetical protein
MVARTLTELLTELYRRLHGSAPDQDIRSAVRRARWENGLADDQQVPTWFVGAVEAVLDGHEVGPVLFPCNADITNFVGDLAGIVPGWRLEDDGEWWAATFPKLDVEFYVSREARTPEGSGCCSYTVRQPQWPLPSRTKTPMALGRLEG